MPYCRGWGGKGQANSSGTLTDIGEQGTFALAAGLAHLYRRKVTPRVMRLSLTNSAGRGVLPDGRGSASAKGRGMRDNRVEVLEGVGGLVARSRLWKPRLEQRKKTRS